jgi:alanine racemase
MPRPILAVISRSAIRHNLSVVRRHAPGSKVWGVVKANAYGHGLERVIKALDQADGLAMLDLAEAKRVRDAGYDRPILLLEGIFGEQDLEAVRALSLTPAIHTREQIQLLARLPSNARLPVYLKINTGMNRLGFAPHEVREAYATLKAMGQVASISLMTHFANAELQHGTDQAVAVFDEATSGLPGERSLSNSAATLLQSGTHRDWVRPGIMLYGASPADDRSAASFQLRAAMTLQSAIISVRDLKPGDSVGYGSRYTARAPTKVGVVACGYADGYPRLAAENTPVLVEGQIVPLIGRVSMDMITVDLSRVPHAAIGSPVELWGDQIPVDQVAAAAGTSGYELLCALAPRVPVQDAD